VAVSDYNEEVCLVCGVPTGALARVEAERDEARRERDNLRGTAEAINRALEAEARIAAGGPTVRWLDMRRELLGHDATTVTLPRATLEKMLREAVSRGWGHGFNDLDAYIARVMEGCGDG